MLSASKVIASVNILDNDRHYLDKEAEELLINKIQRYGDNGRG